MSTVPTLEGTYHTGVALDLYDCPPPARPKDTWCQYEDAALVMTQPADRYNKSIAEHTILPPTASPAVSVTLEKRLHSSMSRIPHVWTAHVHAHAPAGTATTTKSTAYPPLLVAKIFDPVFIDDGEAEYADPFVLRDLAASREVGAYQRLSTLYGTKVPRFHGHFVTPLPSQHDRTVHVVLLEQVPGKDLREIVPSDVAEKVCDKHKDAIIDTALRLYFDILACGVRQTDMQPRNVILRPQQGHVSGTQYCTTRECPLRLEVDCICLHMAMVDFELVDFREPDNRFSEQLAQQGYVDKGKPRYLKEWLESRMA
jgi:hypothetical protein